MARNERYLVGLDIGTWKIACVIAQPRAGGGLMVSGIGDAPSRGLRKGIVVNPDATVDAIKAAIACAEAMAGLHIHSATVGIAGGHIRSFNSRGVVAVSGKDRTVSPDDIRRVLDAARAVSIPQDREILHVLTQEFVLDDQRGISSPRGMIGQHLEANVHIVTGSSASLQNIVTCVNRAGIEVRDMVLEQLAVAEAVLSPDEKDLGVALVDVGGGTTGLAIFEKGSIWHTAVLPVGGEHFTSDLAVGLRTPMPDAERLKKQHGCALAGMNSEDEPIEVPSVGGRKARLLSHQVLSEILQPRAEEILTLAHQEIRRAGFEKHLNAGAVLTGGGSLLPGMIEVAEQIFDVPVRQGAIASDGSSDSPGPHHAAAYGLALHGLKHVTPTAFPKGPPRNSLHKVTHRVRNWFSEMFT